MSLGTRFVPESNPRRLGRAMTVVAVLLVGLGIASNAWLVGAEDGHVVRVGLWNADACQFSGCETGSFTAYAKDSGDSGRAELRDSIWLPLGVLTALSGAIGALMLAVLLNTGALVAARTSYAAFLIALVSAILLMMFIAPDEWVATANAVPGHAFPMFLVGAVAGLVGVTMLWPEPRPLDGATP